MDELGAAPKGAEAAPHKHEWKRADDWDWGPGTVTYECFPCSGLRVVRRAATASAEAATLGEPHE